MSDLQVTQNAALRITTGCVRSTRIEHLHAEAKVLPLKDHMDMRGTQFFAAVSEQEHPCHHLHNPAPSPRTLHNTPAAHFGNLLDEVQDTPPGRLSERAHIHKYFVEKRLSAAPNNSILGVR